MNDQLVAEDKAARQDVLDISRSYIVQAPAGSGKTELLIQRYLRLLVVVDEPEEIVAITFTRKAAEEMRRRVMTALSNARDSDYNATEPYQQITLRAAKRVVSRDDERGWSLTQSPGRMRIQTLDSFNAGIARSLPVSSGLGGISRTLADAELQASYRQAATATLDWLGTGESVGAVVEDVLTHLDNNTSTYISHLSRMLQSRDQWIALLGSGLHQQEDYDAARRRLEQGISDVIVSHMQRLKDLLPAIEHAELTSNIDYAAGNLVAVNKGSEPLALLRGRTDLPACEAHNREEWQAIAGLLLTKTGTFRKTVNKNSGFPPGDSGQKKAFLELIQRFVLIEGLAEQLQRVVKLPPPQYSVEQWKVLVALFRLLPLAVAELGQLYSRKSVCDHIEVALAAAAALGSSELPGEIAMQLDNRIQHLLVDEMQDTSLRQYQLLEDLMQGWTPGDGRTLFCVGDPMQSIYRFRDAEVGQFVLARENGIGPITPEFRGLRRNFRSGEHLVHWFNTVFSQVMPLQNDLDSGAIAYAESVPIEAHAASGEINLHPLIDCDARAEARIGAQLIGDCVAGHPGESVVILVRSRAQLMELISEFRSTGLQYQAVEIDRLTDLPEMIDLLALTRALCHEGDRTAWLGLLHGPFVGLSWEDILALVVNDSHSTVAELIGDKERLDTLSDDAQSRLEVFASKMDAMHRHSGVESLRDRIERCWFELGGPGVLCDENALRNVYQYFDRLEKIEMAGTLADVQELESLLDQERVSSAAGRDCSLQLMTMHKSKGLQFDHVFLYGLGRRTRSSQKSVLSWLNLPDRSAGDMILSPIGARADVDDDPLHQFIEATEKDKQRHELDRLLYVACTRAKKSLNLIGNVMTTSAGDALKGAHAGSLLDRLWPALEPVYLDAFENRDEEVLQHGRPLQCVADRDVLRQPLSRRYSQQWQHDPIPDVPTRPDALSRVTLDADQQVQFYWVGSQARHVGTIVHRWLHRLSESAELQSSAEEVDHQARSARWARQLGVSESELPDVCNRVRNALDKTLLDDRGRWLLSGDGYSELPLTGIWDRQVVSIVIDRVRIDEQGVHWIVDYKTSTHEGGDLAGFIQQEARRYLPQLQKYAEIYAATTDAQVRTALYFPLLQEFREVELS